MKLIVLLLFLQLSQAHQTRKECTIHKQSQNNLENRLRDKIMSDYNFFIPPKPFNCSKTIDVSPSFIVKSFQLLSEKEEFLIYAWTAIAWKDNRLKWDPNDYEGIEDIIVNGILLWLPGLKLYNSINDLYDQSYSTYLPCRIDNNGSVFCVSQITFQAKCLVDLNDWPFDTQVCSLEFEPGHVSGTRIRLASNRISVSFVGSKYGAEWDIMNITTEADENTEIQLKLHFNLMRHAESLAAIVIFPCILLSVLTLSTLFLDVRYDRRVYVTCFSLMCHLYFLSELGMEIPKHSKSSPRVLLYYRGSVIMNIISIVLTLLMKFLYKREIPVPNIIAVVNDNVYKSYTKLLVRPRWDAVTDDEDKRELAKAWADFVSILNCSWAYVSLIVYIVMCCTFIPFPSGLKQNVYFMDYDFES